MPPHDHKPQSALKITGTVMDVFAHRFTVKTPGGMLLADLTPHGAAEVELRAGDKVEIEGEQKPSEIKVSKIKHAGHTYVIVHKPKPDHKGPKRDGDHHPDADPGPALAAAKSAGFKIIGEPRRKPKHFEILGKSGKEYRELHVELNGHIRKSKSVQPDDRKWSEELGSNPGH